MGDHASKWAKAGLNGQPRIGTCRDQSPRLNLISGSNPGGARDRFGRVSPTLRPGSHHPDRKAFETS